MEETMYLNEVLREMRTPNDEGRAVKFSIAVRTLNKFSKTGGKMNRYESAKLVMQEKTDGPDSVYALQNFKPGEKREINKKSPRHFENKTRNIRLDNGEVKKIHILHIMEFNGKKVIY